MVRAFTSDVVDFLNDHCADDEISSVGLGKYNLSVAFDAKLPTIRAESKAAFRISGAEFDWSGEPIAAPVWKLVGQQVDKFEFKSDLVLRLHLKSGDYLDFHTDEGPYEAVIMDFGSRDNALVMEIF